MRRMGLEDFCYIYMNDFNWWDQCRFIFQSHSVHFRIWYQNLYAWWWLISQLLGPHIWQDRLCMWHSFFKKPEGVTRGHHFRMPGTTSGGRLAAIWSTNSTIKAAPCHWYASQATWLISYIHTFLFKSWICPFGGVSLYRLLCVLPFMFYWTRQGCSLIFRWWMPSLWGNRSIVVPNSSLWCHFPKFPQVSRAVKKSHWNWGWWIFHPIIFLKKLSLPGEIIPWPFMVT